MCPSENDNLATREQAKPSVYAFHCTPEAFRHCRTCQTAYTYVGRNAVTEQWEAVAITCKRWSCPACAAKKIKRLSFLVHNAEPNRLLTLTTTPERWTDPRDAFEGTAKQVPELIRSLRVDFGELEYFRVTEATAKGWPHYHLLLRSGFIPHGKIKKRWQELTTASIVDVRKVSNDFRAYQYLVKYLSKLHRIEWTERHVSYSRNFFRPEDLEKYAFPPLEEPKRYECHPFQFLATHYHDESITEVPGDRYLLPYDPPCRSDTVDRATVGLAVEQVTQKRAPLKQQPLDGMSDHDVKEDF